MDSAIDHIYERLDGSVDLRNFAERTGITSLGVLTILTESDARNTVGQFSEAITGKRVVEIGSGVGYLALEMAKHAKSVVAIENEPAWTWLFTKFLYRQKPLNLTWVFGHSSNVQLPADVAVICSRSGLSEMIAEARRMAPIIVLIACKDAVVLSAADPFLDVVADFTSRRINDIFSELQEAAINPAKRADYEKANGPVNWVEIKREMDEVANA